jgi:hypothetical protein
MSTTAFTAELARAPRSGLFPSRLVRAELLKARKRRGLLAATFALSILPMIVGFAILAVAHLADDANHGPAGGVDNFIGSLNMLGELVSVAAILIGATLGSADLGAGVFRELVVTGRSRLVLFAVRIPAGLALLLPFVAAGFAVSATASTLLAGPLERPNMALLAHSLGWLCVTASATLLVALGIASVLGSRGTSIGVLLAWALVVSPFVIQLHSLGAARAGLLRAATQHFEPESILGGAPPVSSSLAAAVAIVLAWTTVSLGLGAWRTMTRDA